MDTGTWLLYAIGFTLGIALVDYGLRGVDALRAQAAGQPMLKRLAPLPTDDPLIAQLKLVKTIRRAGWLAIAFGLFSLLMSNFKDPYGLLLIALGGMSFYFVDDHAILIPYAVIIVWACLNNLLLGQPEWMILSALHLGLHANDVIQQWLQQPIWPITALICAELAVIVVRRYRLFRKILGPADAPQISASGRARRYFPWVGLWLGIIAVAALILMHEIYTRVAPDLSFQHRTGIYIQQSTYLAIEAASQCMALVGLGLSLASLLSKFPAQKAAIIGLVANGLRFVAWIVIAAFARPVLL